MHRRLKAVSAAAILLAVAGCSSASTSPKAHPASPTATASASPDAVYLQALRQLFTDNYALKGFRHLSPQQSSDAKLLAVGHEACKALQNLDPPTTATKLANEGWTRGEGPQIMADATLSFCPDHYQRVADWMVYVNQHPGSW